MKILITGGCGFVGSNIAVFLKKKIKSVKIESLDNLTRKGSRLNRDRLNKFQIHNYNFDIKNYTKFKRLKRYDFIIDCCAEPAIESSFKDPDAVLYTNLIGTFNILEAARTYGVKHLLIASTSSVYGSNLEMPFTEIQKTDTQLSIYAATKKSAEVMSHSYSHLFNIPITCFRFFTVYGPWGRPDMALFKFTDAIMSNKEIDIYNNGEMIRDFTYIDDLVDGILKLIKLIPQGTNVKRQKVKHDSLSNVAPWRVVNIGSSNPVSLLDFVSILENRLGKKARKNFLGMQMGDVEKTSASTQLLKQLINFEAKTSIEEGIDRFVLWYKLYYKK